MARAPEESLHKERGIRRPDLGRFLAGDFADRLRVFDDDPRSVVLAKVAWQLRRMIDELTDDEQLATWLRVSYNVDRDPELNWLRLTDRLELLARRHGRGWSVSTANTKLAKFRNRHVFPRLRQPFPWPPKSEIAELVEAEEKYLVRHRPTTLPGARWSDEQMLSQLVFDASRGARGALERVLPDSTVHFAVSAAGNVVTRATEEMGELVNVFTEAELLRGFQAKIGAPRSDVPSSTVARTLVDMLVKLEVIGLAVNPIGKEDGDGGQYWTPAELASL